MHILKGRLWPPEIPRAAHSDFTFQTIMPVFQAVAPRIVRLPEKKLAGLRMQMSLAQNRTAELWRSFMPLRNRIPHRIGENLFSVLVHEPGYFDSFQPQVLFEKWAAVEVDSWEDLLPELEAFLLPTGLYAVFDYKGSNTDSRIFQYIFTEWLPASDWKLDHRPHFEVMGAKYVNGSPDSEEEIWIPVCRR